MLINPNYILIKMMFLERLDKTRDGYAVMFSGGGGVADSNKEDDPDRYFF